MCPFCLSTIGLVVASTVSTGGLTALAVKLSRKKDHIKEIPNPNESNERSSSHERSRQDVSTQRG
jgi:hypothetical protein